MSSTRTLLTALLALLLCASLACALPATQPAAIDKEKAVAETIAAMQPGQPAAQPTAAEKNAPAPTAASVPTATPPALPVGIRQGLASLNSYHIRFSQVYEGPSAQDKVQIINETDYNSEGERSHTKMTSLNSTKDDPNDKPSVTERYQIGGKVCALPVSEGKSPLSDSNPMAEEMGSTVTSLMDLSIYAENPQLAGEETVNGIKTHHYTFKISGLGKKSGAEVTQSSGDYWIALDGRYLVKYQVSLETRSAPQGGDASVMRAMVAYDLAQVNQPIAIEMPAECK